MEMPPFFNDKESDEDETATGGQDDISNIIPVILMMIIMQTMVNLASKIVQLHAKTVKKIP